VFAPGHLGELTQLVPFEMVDEALRQTGRVQRRVRDLPSRVVVYLMLAGTLFPELGWRQVWQRLTAGLTGLPVASPTGAALAQARKRLTAAPYAGCSSCYAAQRPASPSPAPAGMDCWSARSTAPS
uniref:transposase domain-containing protein n=1 Tax=Nonomuraea sp. LPB2021202275-12-8 TaxID=3120159 RepID=UPI00300C3F05